MIDIPKGKVDAVNLYRDMHNIKHNSPYFFNWLKDQLNILDVENRTAVEDFKQRQGGAQVLEYITEQMDKSQEERIADLERQLNVLSGHVGRLIETTQNIVDYLNEQALALKVPFKDDVPK